MKLDNLKFVVKKTDAATSAGLVYRCSVDV